MSETLQSPGVFTRENDLSFIQPEPVGVSTAFIGPTVKGPVESPTVITSYQEYVRRFGNTFKSGSTTQEFLTSMAVRSFFSQGGNSALITRVASGSFTSATNTYLSSSAKSVEPFEIKTIGEGFLFNNSTGETDPGTENSDGSLVSGSSDNIRWEVSNINNSKGTFSLIIRRGDDNSDNKVVLETFNNVSLDPNENNYIEKVVGSQYTTYDAANNYVKVLGDYPNNSNYIRVSAVNLQTLDYLGNDGTTVREDSSGTSYSASLPIEGSGSFYGATGRNDTAGAAYYNTFSADNIQGLEASDYDDAIRLLANTDEYVFDVVAAPGLTSANQSSQINSLISLAELRGDCIAVVDLVDYDTTISAVQTQAATLNSSYAATYWPFVQLQSETGRNVFVPASTVIPGVFAFTDNSAAPWFAPAGLIRGGIPGVIRAERKLTKANRDVLYESNVNPIASFPSQGISVYGQKTLQKKSSALDRVNVRRLLIELKRFFSEQAKEIVFEQNTNATRNKFLAAVNPYLESVVQRQGLTAFRVVMDETNNTSDVIDRNQLVGQVYIQPSRTAEFIVLDFTVQPTGATFNV